MLRRTALFIDYENSYRNARSVFETSESGFAATDGHFDPWRLGQTICKTYNGRHPTEDPLVLVGVLVYRGEPTNREHQWQSEARARADSWRGSGAEVHMRPLRYDEETGRSSEKGVDMQLGIQFVTKALKREHDVAILFSADHDFIPALQYVRDETDCEAHVAAWGVRANGGFLSLPGISPFVHWVSKRHFDTVADATTYPSRAPGHENNRRRKRRR